MTVETFRRSPLEGRADDLARIGARELALLTQLSVRSRTPGVVSLPTDPNTWVDLGDREHLWLGPDEWLVVGTPGGADVLLEAFGRADSVVDVSANRCVIELEARGRLEMLEQGCPLDLDPRSWREGMCAQTLLAHVPVILQERGSATRIFVRPSFANWLVDWLLSVAS